MIHSLKELTTEQFLQLVQVSTAKLDLKPEVKKRLKESDGFSVLITSPTVLGFTLLVRDSSIYWKLEVTDGGPRIVWKDYSHFVEWMEGKRGMMKLVMLRKVRLEGKIPGWFSAVIESLRICMEEEAIRLYDYKRM